MPAKFSLKEAPDWRNRLRIEYEAASLFGHLGEELSELHGDQDEVVQLCRAAEAEEIEHAQMCIDIIEHSGEKLELNYPRTKLALGPRGMTQRQRIIYSSLAMGCVTETLSTALLTRMLQKAQTGIVKETIHQILKDEVKHSRIGWAELHRESHHQDLSWIQPYIPMMIREALEGDIEPMLSQAEAKDDLSPWGILSPQESQTIMKETIDKIIRPGLSKYHLTC